MKSAAEIIGNIKEKLGITDKELAAEITQLVGVEVKPTLPASWRRDNTIRPELLEYIYKKNMDLNAILFGDDTKEKPKHSDITESLQYGLSGEESKDIIEIIIKLAHLPPDFRVVFLGQAKRVLDAGVDRSITGNASKSFSDGG